MSVPGSEGARERGSEISVAAQLCRTKPQHRRRHGLSLVEMVVSIMLVGVMLVAALGTVGLTQRTRYLAAEQQRAHDLAQALMSEILAQPYADQEQMQALRTTVLGQGTPVTLTIGVEVDESATNRAPFDDVDDYHGWTASPPQEKDGTVLSNLNGWTRSVVVKAVAHNDPGTLRSQDDGLKQITVTVQHDGITRAELVCFRTLQLPDSEACCLPDGTTLDMEPSVCLSLGGVGLGAGSNSLNASCEVPDGPELVVYESFTETKLPNEASSITLVKPEGTEDGDLLIAAVAIKQGGSWVLPPPGWTQIDNRIQNNTRLVVWMRQAGWWEGSDYEFSFALSSTTYGWMMRFSGADPANPIHQQAGLQGPQAWTAPTPAVTTTLDNTLIVRIGAIQGKSVVVDDSGLAEHETITMDYSSTTQAVSGGAGWMALSTAGSSGTASFNLQTKKEYVTLTLALAPELN